MSINSSYKSKKVLKASNAKTNKKASMPLYIDAHVRKRRIKGSARENTSYYEKLKTTGATTKLYSLK